jgi:hypothetical protein
MGLREPVMTSDTADKYRLKAKECDDLAASFADCEAQKILQEIANKLRRRAKETDVKLAASHAEAAEV